ncbi:MAG: hypothetical protein ACK5QW_04000 [Cyanobacteriota bacterium]|jgi:predicted nucleotidyltransferase
MACINLHHQHLPRRWALEWQALEERRRELLAAAEKAAWALRERWPAVLGVWVFGSVLDPAAFQRHSDLDLVVDGLPASAQLEALGLVEGVVDQVLANAGQRGIAIDLALT